MRGPTRGVPEALRCADRGRRGRTYPQVRGEIATCAACFPSGHCHLVAGRGSDAGRATRSRPWGTAGQMEYNGGARPWTRLWAGYGTARACDRGITLGDPRGETQASTWEMEAGSAASQATGQCGTCPTICFNAWPALGDRDSASEAGALTTHPSGSRIPRAFQELSPSHPPATALGRHCLAGTTAGMTTPCDPRVAGMAQTGPQQPDSAPPS